MRKSSDDAGILQQPILTGKIEILSHGLTLTRVADRAGIAVNTLSDYLSGRLRNEDRRFAIYRAFCRLAAVPSTPQGFAEFWQPVTKGHAA